MSNQYPEHEKLQAISEKSQICGDFISWIIEEKDLEIGRWVEDGSFVPAHFRIESLLAEFFDIDGCKLEEEKQQMLEEIRKAHE